MAACNAEVKNSHAAPIPRVQPRGPFFEPAGDPGGHAALIALKDRELWSIRVEHRATPFIQETVPHGHAETWPPQIRLLCSAAYGADQVMRSYKNEFVSAWLSCSAYAQGPRAFCLRL